MTHHLSLATLGICSIALSYYGLINWVNRSSPMGLPCLLLGGSLVYLVQKQLFHSPKTKTKKRKIRKTR